MIYITARTFSPRDSIEQSKTLTKENYVKKIMNKNRREGSISATV